MKIIYSLSYRKKFKKKTDAPKPIKFCTNSFCKIATSLIKLFLFILINKFFDLFLFVLVYYLQIPNKKSFNKSFKNFADLKFASFKLKEFSIIANLFQSSKV